MCATDSEIPGIPASLFEPEDSSADAVFFAVPRLVAHLDDPALARVRQIYAQRLPANGVLLDLMSSYYSHVPESLPVTELIGLGMNEEELRQNERLTGYVVHDLNATPRLPFEDARFDGVMMTAAVQYLRRPVSVFRDLARTMKPDAPLLIVFSNRLFPTKAVPLWQLTSDMQRFSLISTYLELAGGYLECEFWDASPVPGSGDPVYLVSTRRSSDPVSGS